LYMSKVRAVTHTSKQSRVARSRDAFPKKRKFRKYLAEYDRLLKRNPQKAVPGTRAFYVWEMESLGRVFKTFQDDREVRALLAALMVFVHEKDMIAGR
jgi:hypothetical protein